MIYTNQFILKEYDGLLCTYQCHAGGGGDFLLKGFYILRSVTRIMVKTYNCSCNRNMYLWLCSNVYKWRLQSFIWRYFHCAFLGCCLGIFGSNVQPGVGKFGSIWLEWFACGQGIWWQILKTVKSPPHTLPPHRWLYIDKCITSAWKFCTRDLPPPSPPPGDDQGNMGPFTS